MQTFKHITNTWLLALLCFPFFFTGSRLLLNNDAPLQFVPLLFVFGLVFSLPAYGLCFLVMRFIRASNLDFEMKLLCWLGATGIVTAGCSILSFLFLMDWSAFFILWDLTAAAVIAAWVSILLRYNQFEWFIHQQTNYYENNMV